MSELPLVSIVTVVKNCVQHIEETIKSVINQTYPNIEYIIIDGGSVDGTVDIIKKYDDYIDYWISEPDSGISAAFNKGIRCCKGELIGLINAGDKYEVDAVKTVVNTYLNSSGNVFYSDLKCIDEDGKEKYILKAEKHVNKKTFKYRMPAVPHPTIFIKSCIYKHIMFDENYHYAMDYDFLRNLVNKSYSFIYIDKPLSSIRIIGKSNIFFKETINEVYNISIKFGDNKLISYIYNKIYLYIKNCLIKKLNNHKHGKNILFIYRKIKTILRLNKYNQLE
jgi:glycosyltransferase involved in cell wall biosynthesis